MSATGCLLSVVKVKTLKFTSRQWGNWDVVHLSNVLYLKIRYFRNGLLIRGTRSSQPWNQPGTKGLCLVRQCGYILLLRLSTHPRCTLSWSPFSVGKTRPRISRCPPQDSRFCESVIHGVPKDCAVPHPASHLCTSSPPPRFMQLCLRGAGWGGMA